MVEMRMVVHTGLTTTEASFIERAKREWALSSPSLRPLPLKKISPWSKLYHRMFPRWESYDPPHFS